MPKEEDTKQETPAAETPAPAQANPYQPTGPQQAVPAGQVQYVNIVNQKSLEGIGGWLLFWLVIFALNGLTYIVFFFGLLAQPDQLKEAFGITSLIFIPFLAAGYVTSAVLIAMRKKLAVMTSAATFGVAAVYVSIMMIISATKSGSPASEMVPITIGVILAILITNGLFGLYFYVSKRVKATLIN